MAYIRKVKTKSGATAVQIAHKVSGKLVKLEHLGSAHNPKELETLISLAKKRIMGNQIPLFPDPRNKLQIKLKQSYSSLLFHILNNQYQQLGFSLLEDLDFANLCIARIVEPTSKLDSLRVLADLGIGTVDRNRLYRCLQRVIDKDYQKTISQLCFDHVTGDNLNLVLYDVTTLYFEVQKEDGYRKQGLLTDNQIFDTKKDDYRIIYQYREKRARLETKNIELQVAKAKRVINGIAPIKRNRFVSLVKERKMLNQNLIDKAYALAGIKGYV